MTNDHSDQQTDPEDLQEIIKALGIIEIDPDRNYWLVRTQAGEYFEEFYFDEFIAIGWDEISNLQLIKTNDIDRIKERVVEKYPEETRSSYVAGLIARFTNEMKKGDIVIIPSKGSRHVTFGVLQEDEIYLQDPADPQELEDIEELDVKCPFIKRRRVKWLKHVSREKLDLYIHKLLNAHNTIVNANDYAPYIDRSLYKLYKKGDNIHIVFDVKQTNKISAVNIMEFLNRILSTVDVFNEVTGSEYNKEDLDLRINVQSPGPAEFIGMAVGVGIIVSAATIFLFGGGAEIEVTEESVKGGVKSTGLLGRILEFKKQSDKKNVEIMKLQAQVDESKTKLQIAPPSGD